MLESNRYFARQFGLGMSRIALALLTCGFAFPVFAQAGAGAAAIDRSLAKLREQTSGCGEHRTPLFSDATSGRTGDKPTKSLTFRWDEMRLQQGEIVGRMRLKHSMWSGAGAEGASGQEYGFRIALAALSPIVEVKENAAGSGIFSVVAKCTAPGCHHYNNRETKLVKSRVNREADLKAWREEAVASPLADWAADGDAKEATGNEIWILTCGVRSDVEAAAAALSQAISLSAAR